MWMSPEISELLMRWSAGLAVAFYVMRHLVDVAYPKGRPARRIACWSWTIGCGLLVVHVLVAFATVHGWSHREAFDHTAARTQQVIGIDWGGGLFFNYALTLIWIADVAAWWQRGPDKSPRSRKISWSVQLFVAFMIINATVVFGPPYWRWLAPVVAAMFFVARRYRRRSTDLTVA
jgi:hypothetical protein